MYHSRLDMFASGEGDKILERNDVSHNILERNNGNCNGNNHNTKHNNDNIVTIMIVVMIVIIIII